MYKKGMFTANRTMLIGVVFSSFLISNAYAILDPKVAARISVIDESIKQDAEDCAKGDKPGTIGHSIDGALILHLQIAATPPDVEKLFDVNENCFSGINQIIDLSYSIPSMENIISGAKDTVSKYAQKKVCTAINQFSGMVTDPINKAIDKINNNSALANLNGLTSGLANNLISKIDPNLGADFLPQRNPNQIITININPFNSAQVDFSGGNSSRSAPSQQNNTPSSVPDSASYAMPTQPNTTPAQQNTTPAQPNNKASGDVHSRVGNLFN